MRFDIHILGCGSAIPVTGRNPSSQLLNIHEEYYLMDCGEGTQLQLRKFNLRFQRINTIFISHLHGDHYFGLVGLISTMHLMGRSTPLNIYAPPELREIVELQLNVSHSKLAFDLNFFSLENINEPTLIFENKKLKVFAFPLLHRIPCHGFRFVEKELPRNIRKDVIQHYDLPVARIRQIKSGADLVLPSGEIIPNKDLTTDPPKARSYGYVSDTAFHPSLEKWLKGTDYLYHEATFVNELSDRAVETFHSTAEEAAIIAKKAGVQKLILGHFSARYKNLEQFELEAKVQFPEVILAKDGMLIEISGNMKN